MHDCTIRLVEGFPDAELSAIAALAGRIDGADEAWLRHHLEGRRRILTCLAEVDGVLAGYKIGYEDRIGYFESWIGAVAPEYRRRGIARALMERQHRWCEAQGFRIVSTTTMGNNRAMLIANLQAGFEVCGTFLDRGKILKVVMQRGLGTTAFR